MATTYLTHTPSNGGTPGTQTFTLSFWIKRSKLSLTQRFLGAYTSANLNTNATFNSNDTFQFYNRNTNAGDKYFVTNRKFRDTNAWYHFVIAIDTTLSTEADRVKFYVNGVEETSFSEVYEPPQNYEYRWGEALAMNIGVRDATNSDFFDGSMSHFHYIDGTQYSASDFGETDANGVWKIKTSPSVTYGNDGYFILKDGNSVTDQSGNGNNFTVGGGTLTNTEDSPSNVFATMNPLDNIAASTFSEGNNTVTTATSSAACNTSTLGVNSGKYYWEVKMTAGESNQEAYMIGLVNASPTSSGYSGSIEVCGDGFALRGNGGIWNGSSTATGWNTFAVNDIINIAVDFDNGKAYFGTNGTWGNSSNPSTGTNGYSFTVGSEFWRMAVNCRETSKDGVFKCNFGNGYFGTTAVASAGTNASGNGIFEYDVPTGYTALSTKGLNL